MTSAHFQNSHLIYYLGHFFQGHEDSQKFSETENHIYYLDICINYYLDII